MEHVVYNGIDLSERFRTVVTARPLPVPTPVFDYVTGGNRNFIRGIDIVPPTPAFRVVSMARTRDARREEIRYLASVILNVSGPVRVQFSSDNGRWFKAVPTGDIGLREYVSTGCLDVTLTCEEAAMYGELRTVQSSGGTANINVGGNYPTTLNISASSATRQSSSDYRFGYRLDNGAVQYVEIGTASQSNVVMDGDKRHVTVNGTTAQLTLQSDWFEVACGMHAVTRTMGSGEFTVSWYERWL